MEGVKGKMWDTPRQEDSEKLHSNDLAAGWCRVCRGTVQASEKDVMRGSGRCYPQETRGRSAEAMSDNVTSNRVPRSIMELHASY